MTTDKANEQLTTRGSSRGLGGSTGKKPFANTPEFYTALGYFYAPWSRTDLAIDCALWKASRPDTPEQIHERVARMKFSDKCEYFRSLVECGKFEEGDKVKHLLAQIEDSMRNVFAHSFLASDEDSVKFIHRKAQRGRKYQATGYKISGKQFIEYVQNFVQLSSDFERAVGLSHKEVADFAAMAIPLATAPQDGP